MLHQDGIDTCLYLGRLQVRKHLASALALLLFAAPAAAQQLGPVNIPPPPCTAFGTAAGTCAQGGVISAGGPTGGATTVPVITYNAAGQLTAVTTASTGVTAVGTATVGQIPGATDATAPTAGNIGETLRSVVSNAAPTTGFATGTAKDVTTRALTGGQWTCWGSINTNPAGSTTTTGMYGGLSLTADTLPADPAERYQGDTLTAAAGSQLSIPIAAQVFNVAGAGATVHLVGRAGFAVSTMGMSGFVTCQRTA